jgi:spermidine synthase
MLKKFSKTWLLLLQILIVSVCSLIYELLIATTATNITSNSILAFSLVIGLFLAGLGTGAFISQWIKDKNLVDVFIWNETVLAIIGGFSVITLYFAWIFTPYFYLIQTLITFLIGLLSGLEIPILTRILNNQEDGNFKSIIAKVLSFDYLGGLVASLLFPLVLLQYFGLVKLSFLVGILNCLMALLAIYIFWNQISKKIVHLTFSFLVFFILLISSFFSLQIYNFVESYLYRDPIIYSTQSKYQRIVVTKKNKDMRLYLNGGIQFSSLDEYRYHESLVMPALLQLISQKSETKLNIAIFGGGDGLAVREVLKFENFIAKIHLVDIDKQITDLAKDTNIFKDLNQNSLSNQKVTVLNEDAWGWIQKQKSESLDLIICDFPDPDETAISKLYSKEFYNFSNKSLSKNGLLVTQSSSPYSTPKVFWSINKTLQSVFPEVKPYTTYIPSFGLWGFNLVTKNSNYKLEKIITKPENLEILAKNQFIKPENLEKLFVMDTDILNPKLKNGEEINLQELKINTLDNLILTNYYYESGQEI